jgi:hypothetical protein
MLGNAKALKKNNWECKGVLIGPSFFSTTRFRHSVFRSLTKSRSRLRAQILRRGWHADVTHECARPELVVRLGHTSGTVTLLHFLRAEPWPPPPKKQARPNK